MKGKHLEDCFVLLSPKPSVMVLKPSLYGTSTFTTSKRLICHGKGSQTQMNVMNYEASEKKKDTPDDGISFPFSMAEENVKSERDAKKTKDSLSQERPLNISSSL